MYILYMLHYLANTWLFFFFDISLSSHSCYWWTHYSGNCANQYSFSVEHNYTLGFLSSMVLTSIIYLMVLINTKQYVVGFQY